ncbi:MAG: hypothetical protein ACKO3K_02195 [Cuspidothrix sp.]
MKIPKSRLFLLTFLPSVFSCFVITACTSEQPKRTGGSVTTTVRVTSTPEPTATPSPTETPFSTETPSPTYTSNPNRDSTECQSIVPSSCAKSGGESIIADSDAKNRSDKSKSIVGRWQSRYNANSPISGNYQIITTVKFYSDGTLYEFQYNTSNDPISYQLSGQWKRTDEDTIFTSVQNPYSGKVIEEKYRIIDQDTIINSYGYTYIRLP